MMSLSRPRLQVVQNEEISKAIETIRKYRPGLINDSMVVTSALVEYAIALESDKPRQASDRTPYNITIVRTGVATYDVGIFRFLLKNFNHITAIFAHIDDENDSFMDYVSRKEKPVYTFVMKGKGFTDFEFIHIAASESFFAECLTLLVLDFNYYRKDIRFNVIRANHFEERYGQKAVTDYVPSLDEMARVFFHDVSSREETSSVLDLDWEANTFSYKGFEVKDTRYVDYSHALVGLKTSSLSLIEEKYGVEALVWSGVLAVERYLLHHRYRCLCDGWAEERQDLDLYELGRIFGQHFGYKAIFSPAKFLYEIANFTTNNTPIATVYVEKGKRIEVLPMKWERSWFTCNIDGKVSYQGHSRLNDDPNPFKLYDMNDFFPNDLERYSQKKKSPK